MPVTRWRRLHIAVHIARQVQIATHLCVEIAEFNGVHESTTTPFRSRQRSVQQGTYGYITVGGNFELWVLQGKEATFAQLAVAPIFVAKVPVGMLSGYLVAKYLPENGANHGSMLWLIVGLLAM
jgi:hypothetical protein